MKVKITQSKDQTAWYADKIGAVFEVDRVDQFFEKIDEDPSDDPPVHDADIPKKDFEEVMADDDSVDEQRLEPRDEQLVSLGYYILDDVNAGGNIRIIERDDCEIVDMSDKVDELLKEVP